MSSKKAKIAKKILGNDSMSRQTACEMCVNWFMYIKTGASIYAIIQSLIILITPG